MSDEFQEELLGGRVHLPRVDHVLSKADLRKDVVPPTNLPDRDKTAVDCLPYAYRSSEGDLANCDSAGRGLPESR